MPLVRNDRRIRKRKPDEPTVQKVHISEPHDNMKNLVLMMCLQERKKHAPSAHMLALYANNNKIKLDHERSLPRFSRFLAHHRAALLPFGAVFPEETLHGEGLPVRQAVAQPSQMIMEV